MAKNNGKRARTKGKVGERELATQLREDFPEFSKQIRRGWQCRVGTDEADIEGFPCFRWEAKRQKQANVRAALKQVLAEAAVGQLPIAWVRDDRQEAFIAMRYSDFVPLLRAYLFGSGGKISKTADWDDEQPIEKKSTIPIRE